MINNQMRQFPIVYTGPVGRTAIGWGVHTTVADECKAANVKKALIVTTGLKGTGIIDEIKGILEYNGIATELYDKITSNPKDYQVMEAYKVFKEGECDGVVSIGGGSSHDCGKGVRIVACNDGKDILDFVPGMPWAKEMLKYKPVTIPQISVNTTAGTSAESTSGAQLTDTKAHSKIRATAPGVYPTIALIDPLLIRLMPPHIAAWTGWDAFAHAFEGYLARVHLPEAAAVCSKVVELIAENLREFVYNRMNHVACENMCYAESIPRITIGLAASPGILHGVATKIGGLTDCHHGRVIAMMTLPTQRYNEAALPDRYAEMAGAMGVDTRGMTKMKAADKWFDEVERLLADLNIKTGHLNEQVGLQQKDLKDIAASLSSGFAREGNPRTIEFDDALQLLEDMV
ncbi:iron-containing alcohol dehydrogenase [Chloroflexota bacterium]